MPPGSVDTWPQSRACCPLRAGGGIRRGGDCRRTAGALLRSSAPLKWQAGQFLHYSLPHPAADDRGITRYFTIASAPFEGHVMLTTRSAAERSSSFKRALRQLPVGAAVDVGEPDGDFVVGDPGDEHVLIAGGIGVTPFRAILLDLDHRELPINATLLYANRSQTSCTRPR